MTVPICPHCGCWHDGRVIKVCVDGTGIDKTPWTQPERDAWREQARRLGPIHFAPSSASFASRFGHLALQKGAT